MRVITNIDHSLSEREEIDLYTMTRSIVELIGQKGLDDLLISEALKTEQHIREKYGPEWRIIALLDEYHQQVSMGLREPLP